MLKLQFVRHIPRRLKLQLPRGALDFSQKAFSLQPKNLNHKSKNPGTIPRITAGFRGIEFVAGVELRHRPQREKEDPRLSAAYDILSLFIRHQIQHVLASASAHSVLSTGLCKKSSPECLGLGWPGLWDERLLCVYTSIFMCKETNLLMYVRVFVRIYECMYVCMRTRIYIYIYRTVL